MGEIAVLSPLLIAYPVDADCAYDNCGVLDAVAVPCGCLVGCFERVSALRTNGIDQCHLASFAGTTKEWIPIAGIASAALSAMQQTRQ